MTKNLEPIIRELHKAFDLLNKHFYEGKLPEVVIAIRSQGKRKGVNGWFTPDKAWTDGKEEKHEIVICAETLDRDFYDIMRTLHHECIHLYCHTNDIKDVSRGGSYHNKRFKQECENHGFFYPYDAPDSKIGYSACELLPETIETIRKWNLNADVFGIKRKTYGDGTAKKKKKSNIIKWICPNCNFIVRTSKDNLKAVCMNEDEEGNACGVFFEKESPDEDLAGILGLPTGLAGTESGNESEDDS